MYNIHIVYIGVTHAVNTKIFKAIKKDLILNVTWHKMSINELTRVLFFFTATCVIERIQKKDKGQKKVGYLRTWATGNTSTDLILINYTASQRQS